VAALRECGVRVLGLTPEGGDDDPPEPDVLAGE
jgi:hypothetical protein